MNKVILVVGSILLLSACTVKMDLSNQYDKTAYEMCKEMNGKSIEKFSSLLPDEYVCTLDNGENRLITIHRVMKKINSVEIK